VGTSFKKKVDSRAPVNREAFNDLNREIEEYTKQLDMQGIKSKHQQLSDTIGD